METRELRYFVAVAEELNFARAAARIGIQQPPLSRAISALERQLGVQLFIRTRRNTTLTRAGEQLLRDARRILAEIECIQHNLKAAVPGRGGCLRIAVCDGVAHPRLARLLAQSREYEPDIDIRVIHSPFSEQLHRLRSGMLDVAFGLHPSSDRDLHSLPLWRDAAVLVIRSDHPLAERQTIERIESDLAPLLLLGEPASTKLSPLEILLRSSAHACERVEYVSSIEVLLTLVAAGCGAGVISAAQGETIHRPDLAVRLINTAGVRMTTFLMQRTDDASRLITRFRERAQRMAGESDVQSDV